MYGTVEGVLWLTSDSSERCSRVWLDLRRIRSDMGFRILILDFPDFLSVAVGGGVDFGVLDSMSLIPPRSEV